jgi:hypothetical protein
VRSVRCISPAPPPARVKGRSVGWMTPLAGVENWRGSALEGRVRQAMGEEWEWRPRGRSVEVLLAFGAVAYWAWRTKGTSQPHGS